MKHAVKRVSWRSIALAMAATAVGWLGYTAWTLPDPRPLATRNPAVTALMAQRAEEARAAGLKPRRRHLWVPLSAVSPRLVDAVLASEDSAFFHHHGVDTVELENAAREAWRKRSLGRGASTLTQQLAKNLWLSGDRSLIRKLKELILTLKLERALSKQRILTLYLNVAEWGEGIYGIEAAAQEHFGKPAYELDTAQASILAAMLPAPRRRSLASRSPALRKRALWIIDRLEQTGRLESADADSAREAVARILGSPVDRDEEDGERD